MTDAGPLMALPDHLAELRRRVVIGIVAVLVGSVAGWVAAPRVLSMLATTGGIGPLVFFSPSEAFFTYLRLACTMGVAAASPVLFYQVWGFVAPGLFPHERRLLLRLLPLVTTLFLAGCAFGYFAVYPVTLRFVLGFSAGTNLIPAFSAGRFLGFIIGVTLPFGLIFELPLIAFGLARFGVIDGRLLRRHRRTIYVGAFVVGAVLTPPDILSQLLMAVPLLILFEVSTIIVDRTEPVEWLARENAKVLAGLQEPSAGVVPSVGDDAESAAGGTAIAGDSGEGVVPRG